MASKPSSAPEWAIIVICMLFLLANLAILIYCYIRREYMPLKALNLVNMNLTFVSMVMTFVGSIYIGSSQFAKKDWTVCAVTIGWLGMSLGALSFVGLFMLRLYRYLNVFVFKRRATGIYFMIPLAYLVAISALYAVLSFVMSPSAGYGYTTKTNLCTVGNPIFITGVIIFVIQGLLVGFMLFKTRQMECCFNEFRKMLICSGILLLSGILTIAFHFVKIGTEDNQVASGIVKLLAIFIPQQAYFFLILGIPVYRTFKDNNGYLDEFVEKVEKQGLSLLYELASKSALGEISSMSDYGRSRNISMQSAVTARSNFSGNVPRSPSIQPNDTATSAIPSTRQQELASINYHAV